MDTPATPSPSASALFEDGLGKRHFTTGPAGEALDVLVLSDALAAVPAFEAALRARPAQFAQFQHPAFGRVRGLVRLPRANAKGSPHNAVQRLGVVSEHVDGMRLSELLAVAERDSIPLPFDAAAWAIRELVTALAAFHAALSGTGHGAIAPERIVITPDSTMVVVDHVLGPALEQLRFTPERYWAELRIALPRSGGDPRVDERTDLLQVGAVALALIAGRRLRDDEDPAVDASLLGSARLIAADGDRGPLPAPIRAWLSRMLQSTPQTAFTSFAEGLADFGTLPGLPAQSAGRAAFAAFVAACSVAMIDEPRSRAESAPGPAPIAPPADAPPVEPPAAIAESIDRVDRPDAADPVDEPVGAYEPSRARWLTMVSAHARAVALGAAALVVMSLAGVAAHMYASTPPPAATGTLVVTTDPAGAAVVIDGRHSGVTPLTLALASGDHVMVLGGSEPRTVHVQIAPGAQVSQFYQLAHAAPSAGQLQVRSDPPGAKVSIDGESRGVAPLTVDHLAPGTHEVLLENDLGSVKESVQVEAGATASLVVPMTAPAGAPLSGWVTVDSPGDVQLFENQQLLGNNKIDRIMLPVGRHDLEVVNAALGIRTTRSVQVTAGQVTTMKVEWPSGSLALNALPWADVWVDGQRVGQTPMANLAVPAGVHEVVFRHPDLGEQRFTTTVTAGATARVSADLRKK